MLFQLGVDILQVSSKPSLCYDTLFSTLLELTHVFTRILCQNLISFKVSDFADAVVRQLLVGGWLLWRHFSRGVYFVLLRLDKIHELFNVVKWITFMLIVFFTARAVHVLMLLARKVFHYPLKFWR